MGFHKLNDFRKSSALACNRQQISNQFQNLAVQQRRIQQVLAELNQERHEVTMIQENLKKTNLDRKCWRMVGKSKLLIDLFKTIRAVPITFVVQIKISF